LIVAVIGGGLFLLAASGIAVPFFTFTIALVIVATLIETLRITNALRQSDAAVTRLTAGREHEAESKRVLAHELTTPLASMRGLSQLLAGFDLTDAERRRVASMLEAEAGKLQSLVGGLLDLERLPLRDFQSSTAVIDLGDIVRMRVNFLQASTDRPLIVAGAPNVFVRADPSLIERVIDNLVGNALKYAPPPSPVTISTRAEANSAVIEVEDRGAGLSEGERERVFDRFFRGTSAAGTQGLGLGLSLVAEVAKWHGGNVLVERAAAGGSVFRFTLPLAPAVAKAGAM
jgi:two-component system, OmpR family, sensor histidine kinase KdpD